MEYRLRQLKSTAKDLEDDNEDLRRQLERSRRGENDLIEELELLRQETSRMEIELQLKSSSLGQWFDNGFLSGADAYSVHWDELNEILVPFLLI